MNASKTILVVDDEATIRDVLRRYLERESYTVLEAGDGYTVLDLIESQPIDLIVLDLMLPGIDGLTLTSQIHDSHRIPIIMLTAKGDTRDRIRGLNSGADDYVAKPFSPQEVVSRVQAVLRRVEKSPLPAEEPILYGNLSIDPVGRRLMMDQKDVPLTAKEFDLLWLFASHPGRVFTRPQLLERIWGSNFYGDPSTVTVHIRRLREKIEADASHPNNLLTVWGVGYKFEGQPGS